MISAVLIIGLVFVTDAKPYGDGDGDNWTNFEQERRPAYLSDDDVLYEGQRHFFITKFCFVTFFESKLCNYVMFFKSEHSW